VSCRSLTCAYSREWVTRVPMRALFYPASTCVWLYTVHELCFTHQHVEYHVFSRHSPSTVTPTTTQLTTLGHQLKAAERHLTLR
jgi:hypothetical protein